ncbi:MAG: YqhA family protein [Acidimicrobiales bacterium]
MPLNGGKILGGTRFLFVIAFVASLVTSAALFIFAGFLAVHYVWDLVREGGRGELGTKHFIAEAVQIADVVLIATALYTVAFGLYGIFLGSSDELPRSVRIHTIDELKASLVKVTVVALGVYFLGTAFGSGGEVALLEVGVGVGAVILALAAFLWAEGKAHESHQAGGSDPS